MGATIKAATTREGSKPFAFSEAALAECRSIIARYPAERSKSALSIHPNPASTWVALEYDLLVEPTEAALAIRDLAGREVYRRTLTDRKQEVVWDTRQMAPGSYTVVLLNGGRQLRAEKLIIRQ